MPLPTTGQLWPLPSSGFLSGGGGSADASGWVRPADWLPLPEASTSFKGLMAVTNDSSNYVALSAAGNYTVDWGDGTVENIASGVQANHQFVYANIPSGTLTTRGYRQAIVTVAPQAGQTFTAINLNLRHTRTGLIANASTGWLDLSLDGPALTSIQFAYTNTNVTNIRHALLERAQVIRSALTAANYLFKGLLSLQSMSLGQSGITDMSNMFDSCTSLRSVPLFDTSSVTNMSSMFITCPSLKEVPLFNTALVTTVSSMFSGCYTLREVPPFNTVKVVNMTNFFNGCTSLRRVPAMTANAVTGGNINGIFSGCHALTKVEMTGFKVTFTLYGQLNAPELDAVYAGLASGVTGQTITVTGNPGIDGDDPTIATAKGWTVTGS